MNVVRQVALPDAQLIEIGRALDKYLASLFGDSKNGRYARGIAQLFQTFRSALCDGGGEVFFACHSVVDKRRLPMIREFINKHFRFLLLLLLPSSLILVDNSDHIRDAFGWRPAAIRGRFRDVRGSLLHYTQAEQERHASQVIGLFVLFALFYAPILTAGNNNSRNQLLRMTDDGFIFIGCRRTCNQGSMKRTLRTPGGQKIAHELIF
jgi:hypothetical protein